MTVTTNPSETNGVDVATLFATLDAVKAQPGIASGVDRRTKTVATRPAVASRIRPVEATSRRTPMMSL